MEWEEYIHVDTEILVGTPIVKGTQLAADFILGLLAEGWSEQRLLDNYPTLTVEALRAVYAFAAECMRGNGYYLLESG